MKNAFDGDTRAEKGQATLYASIGNENSQYVTITVSYDGERIVSVLFEAADDSAAVKAGNRLGLEP